MGRPSKLTEKQWTKIGQRLLAGEKARPLAREFGVAESTIRERFSDEHGKIKEVASQVVAAELAMKALPISAQVSARGLADRLRSISEHLAGSAEFGASTAYRLSGIASRQAMKISDDDPMETAEVLQGISALTKLSNDASAQGIALINATRGQRSAEDEPAPLPVQVIIQVVDASVPRADT